MFMPAPATKASAGAGNMTYRMPAEWERHAATWLAWPKNRSTWPGKSLAQVEGIYLQMIAALLEGETVNLLVDDKPTAEMVLSRLQGQSLPELNRLRDCPCRPGARLIFHRVRTADAWIRDYGPIFVGRRAFTKWKFNAWGGKYRDLAKDDSVVDRIGALKKFKRVDTGMVLEGGAIDVDGQGTCLTTEQCLLSPNRNPELMRWAIEERLGRFLGIRKVIWLKKGIEGDDTDGHVDNLARFVAPATVVTAASGENLNILESARDARGRRLKIVKLPMPRPPASYANFYIANTCVLLPVYSHKNDGKAVRFFEKIFTKKRIIPIESSALVRGFGSIHCVTQQQPV